MKTLSVQQLIEKLQAVEDKSTPVLFSCQRCEISYEIGSVPKIPHKVYWHPENEECPNDEGRDLDRYTGCDCGPLCITVE